MRAGQPKVFYLVGTPKGRLSALEAALVDKPWQAVRVWSKNLNALIFRAETGPAGVRDEGD